MFITDLILALVVLTNLKLLGSSRLGASIRVVAAQGVALGLLPILAHWPELSVHFALLAAGTIAIKGVVFPWLLSGQSVKLKSRAKWSLTSGTLRRW